MEDDQKSEVEKQFEKAAKEAESKIQDKLNQASNLIAEAEKLSEEYGVPFYANVSPLSQSYFPDSLNEKWPDLDSGFVSDVTGAYSEYGYGGWEHSAVC